MVAWMGIAIWFVGAMAAAIPVWSAARAATIATIVSAIGAVWATSMLALRAVDATRDAWFTVLTVLFVAILSTLVQAFAVRHLRADEAQRWFVGWVNVLTAGSIGVAAAPTILGFAAAWSVTGVGLLALLASYRRLAQAKQGVVVTGWSMLVGDGALWAAAIIIVANHGGDVTWARLPAAVSTLAPSVAGIAAVLIVAAGLSRSAQLPFQRWLPVTLAAPTPVSAIMHAGVVNAATLLVFHFLPLLGDIPAAMTALFLAGAATMVTSSAAYLLRPDLKGRLVASTSAQMGFMVMTLGAGAFAAALFHLFGHGFYKANLFRAAGSQIDAAKAARRRPAPVSPRTRPRVVAIIAAVLVPGLVWAAAWTLLPAATVSSTLLAAYGWSAAAVVLYALLIHVCTTTLARALSAVLTAAATAGYLAVTFGFEQLIGLDRLAAAWTVPWWALAVPLVLVAAMSTVPVLAPSDSRFYGLLSALSAASSPRVRGRGRRRSSRVSPLPIVKEFA